MMMGKSMIFRCIIVCALAFSAPAFAQSAQVNVAAGATQPATQGPVAEGPVTRLPMPRYVSLKARESNVRRGPSLSHRIDWVFKRRNMPLQIVAEYGHWRRVVDQQGQGGWVHYTMLSGVRQVVVETGPLTLHAKPSEDARARAQLEAGVIARLGDCTLNWCELTAGGYSGWAPKNALWGVDADELRD